MEAMKNYGENRLVAFKSHMFKLVLSLTLLGWLSSCEQTHRKGSKDDNSYVATADYETGKIPEDYPEITADSVSTETKVSTFNRGESDNISISGDNGATVPWIDIEAEVGETNGTIIHKNAYGSIGSEASGNSYVELKETNQYVKFKTPVGGDRLTVRYSIPRGDKDNTLSVYVNEKHITDFTVASRRIWQGKKQVPGGYFRRWDEASIVLTVQPGDLIILKKDQSDTSSFYLIDFVEVEKADNEKSIQDSSWLSITDYGANGLDGNDDTKAIRNCISAADKGSKKVWVPKGTFYITDEIDIPIGVQIAGAGMWHSIIAKKIPGSNRKSGIRLKGLNIIKDIKISDILGNRRIGGHLGIRLASDCVIEDVWVENTFGGGMTGFSVSNVIIKNCRVRGSHADGIHFARNSQGNTVENCAVRNAGDDGIAFIAYEDLNLKDNVVKYNTVENGYWGRGICNFGGENNIIQKNLVKDIVKAGILVGVENYGGKNPNPYNKNFDVSYNSIYRCGQSNNNDLGALCVRASIKVPVYGNVQHNNISGTKNGISVTGYTGNNIYIRHNTIDAPRNKGRYIFTNLKSGNNPNISDNTLLEKQ